MAQRFGVQVSDSTLDQAFPEVFQQPHRRYFQGHQRIPECEFEWWNIVALCTFQQAGVLDQFSDFSAFFTELYTPSPLANPGLFIRCSPPLEHWQQLGIELGVLSNFDSRLYWY